MPGAHIGAQTRPVNVPQFPVHEELLPLPLPLPFPKSSPRFPGPQATTVATIAIIGRLFAILDMECEVTPATWPFGGKMPLARFGLA
ncbi:hypothetical protein BH11MYX1_BH11MYX1_25180 [soil metagenome]